MYGSSPKITSSKSEIAETRAETNIIEKKDRRNEYHRNKDHRYIDHRNIDRRNSYHNLYQQSLLRN
jgi:hypothetical protein